MNQKIEILSQQDFLDSFIKVPRIAINLLVKDNGNKILLTKRNISPFKDFWHLPGSFLLKNEQICQAQKRIAHDELGFDLHKNIKIKLRGAFDDLNGDPRGHVVDLVYELKLNNFIKICSTKGTSEIKFFEKNNLPEKIGFNHESTLNSLGYFKK